MATGPMPQPTSSVTPLMPPQGEYPTMPYTVDPEPVRPHDPLLQKIKQLEQRFRTMEGTSAFGPSDPYSLCLVLGIILPP